MSKQYQMGGWLLREVAVRADTFNEERTVEVIWATGAPVKRYSWDEGYYMEELSMDPKQSDSIASSPACRCSTSTKPTVWTTVSAPQFRTASVLKTARVWRGSSSRAKRAPRSSFRI